MDLVARNLDYAKSSTADVIDAIRRRAIADGPDSLTNAVAFLRIVDHPAADDLDDLIPGRSNGSRAGQR